MLSVFIKPSEDQCPKTMVWLRFCLFGALNQGRRFVAFFEGGFVVVVEFVFQRQCAHSGEDVDNHAQAVVAGQLVAPFGGFVAVHFGEKLFVFFAAQLGFGFAGEQFGTSDGPLWQDAGVNHNMADAFDEQGLETQPVEHFFAVGVGEDGCDGVAAFDRTFAAADGEQVQVVVAENHTDAAFVFHAELEDFEGFGAAVGRCRRRARGCLYRG